MSGLGRRSHKPEAQWPTRSSRPEHGPGRGRQRPSADQTGIEEKARSDSVMLGRLVRSLRVGRDMSIDDLAEATGLSAGGISQIERGLGNPSFMTLVKLAYGMQVQVGSFLRSDHEEPGLVVKAEHRKRLVSGEGLIYELLTPDLNRRLEVLKVQIACGFDNTERPFVHEGEECIHLLSGRLLIYIDGDEYCIEEGDSITYGSSVPHWYRNPFEEPATIFSAITPPSF